MTDPDCIPVIDRPIVILGAPRSGTTIIQACLALHHQVWHLRAESHAIFEGPFHPSLRGYSSNRLTREDAESSTIRDLRRRFVAASVNLNLSTRRPERILGAEGQLDRVLQLPHYGLARFAQRGLKQRLPLLRLVEKTPKNCLRIPFLESLFPNALYLLIHRDPVANVRSLHTAWVAGRNGHGLRPRFGRHGYPIAHQLRLPDYGGKYWKFALVPQWRSLQGQSIVQVAVWQYVQCNRYARQDLLDIAPRRVFHLRHERFVQEPAATVDRILTWAELPRSAAVDRFVSALPTLNSVRTHNNPLPLDDTANDAIAAALAPFEKELRTLARPTPDWWSGDHDGRAASAS